MPTVHSEGTSLQSLLSSTRAATTSSQAPTAVLSRMNTTTTNVVTSLDNWRGSQPVASVTSTPGFSVSTFVTPVVCLYKYFPC